MLAGVLSAGCAFFMWGVFPLYLKTLKAIPPLEILSHRVFWSFVMLALILTLRHQWGWITSIKKNPRITAAFIASASMLAINWVVYIWSINHDRIVDASLGYFIAPLFNVLFGVMLGERLRLWQWISVGLAATGVAWLTISAGQLPWIGLTLAFTFGLYGLLRKTASLGALEGLTLETLVMLPLSALFLLLPESGSSHAFVNAGINTSLLLIAAGPVTAIPLLLFAYGARRIPLSLVGILQYIGPTIQLLLGLYLYNEAFSSTKLIGYGLIWCALGLYSIESLWQAWRNNTSS
jgi:chloramphenicol-sensitive protein RarD